MFWFGCVGEHNKTPHARAMTPICNQLICSEMNVSVHKPHALFCGYSFSTLVHRLISHRIRDERIRLRNYHLKHNDIQKGCKIQNRKIMYKGGKLVCRWHKFTELDSILFLSPTHMCSSIELLYDHSLNKFFMRREV